MTPAQVIECAIGLFDDRDVPRGKRPPVLAAHILAELQQHGYRVASIPDPWCDWCGTAIFPCLNKTGWADRRGVLTCPANDEDHRHEPAAAWDAATTVTRSTTDQSRAGNSPSEQVQP
jgi:hypothetical protein